jgi:hypothetical protein
MEAPIKAVVVSVEYSGHDCSARLDSLHNTVEEAEVRAGELMTLNQDFGDEQHFAISFADVEGEVVIKS